jgi:uncharacterized membrane protein
MTASAATRAGAATAGAPPPEILFETILRPRRSLGRRGIAILSAAVGIVSLANGMIFWLAGAWPVVGFCGVDAALLWFLLNLNMRRAERRYEAVRLTEEALTVEHGDHRGVFARFALAPGWLRVDTDESELGQSRVTVSARGQAIAVGLFLSPFERRELAAALRAALVRLRTPPSLRG